MKTAVVLAGLLLAMMSAAFAQGTKVAVDAVTVGAGSGVAQAARPRSYLVLLNISTTARINCTIDGSTAVLDAAGTISMQAGGGFIWDEPDPIPNTAITCIASAGGTPMTILTK